MFYFQHISWDKTFDRWWVSMFNIWDVFFPYSLYQFINLTFVKNTTQTNLFKEAYFLTVFDSEINYRPLFDADGRWLYIQKIVLPKWFAVRINLIILIPFSSSWRRVIKICEDTYLLTSQMMIDAYKICFKRFGYI